MEEHNELKKWWLSIDGDLNPTEQKHFEEALEKDAELAETFAQAKSLDAALKNQEAEQPSMRFSKNVFEQLPQLYKKISIEPLFSKKAIKIGIGTLFTVFLASVTLVFFVEGVNGNVESNFWSSYVNQLLNIPDQWLLSIGLVSFCVLAVMLLDQFLKRQILKRRPGSS